MALTDKDIVIKAILTKKGREKLMLSPEDFKITQFSLHDDEVNYDLFFNYGASTSETAGKWIEKIPILEPSADEELGCRFKLVKTRDIGKTQLVITPPRTSISYNDVNNPSEVYFTFKTENINDTNGYIVTIYDPDIASFEPIQKNNVPIEKIYDTTNNILMIKGTFGLKVKTNKDISNLFIASNILTKKFKVLGIDSFLEKEITFKIIKWIEGPPILDIL